ncbi:MAG: tetratricopeptide repeat protein [Acidobacteria bacterium]|nr:MAG: tetratricopeptide repeat protein [Acidobacteriota bacterium]
MNRRSATRPTEPAARPAAGTLLAVFLVALVPYVRVPSIPLLSDCHIAIENNPYVRERPLGEIFGVDFWGSPLDARYATGSYRPLVTLSWALQVRAFGYSPRVLHLTDMALHGVGAVLVALIAGALLRHPRAALAAGILFGVHPVLSEAVVSGVGRADLMASVALLAALLVRLRVRRRAVADAASAALVGAALLCKEYAVSFPFLLAAADLIAARAAGTRPDWRRLVPGWGAMLALLGGYLGLRYALIGAVGGVPMLGPANHPLYGQPLSVRWATALWMFVHAFRLVLVPIALSAFHQGYGALAIARSFLEPRALAGAALLAGLAAGAGWALHRRRQPVPAIAFALFFFPLAPSLNTVSLAGVLLAERFLYLPTAGLALLAGLALRWWFDRKRERPAIVWAAVGVAAVLLAAGTDRRVGDWRSEESLARAALAWYPEADVPWYLLGQALGRQGRDAEAAQAFERSLAINDRNPMVWKNYAVALGRLGRLEEAARAYRRSLQLSPPDLEPLWRGLGRVELKAGHFERALSALRRAHELRPDDATATVAFAQALLRVAQKRLGEGRAEEAVALAREAAGLSPLPPDGRFLAALVLHRAGAADEAREQFDIALREDPELLRRRHEQAMKLERESRYDEAAELFREILAARPDHVPSLFNLGRALLLAGRPDEAVEPLERGLALRDDPAARALLARARAASGRPR